MTRRQSLFRSFRRVLAVLVALVIVLVGTILAHDEIVTRREDTPFNAYFKARFGAPRQLKEHCDQVRVVEDESTIRPETVQELGDGRYRVRLDVRIRHGGTWSQNVPVHCTMLCGGLDDWTLEEYQLDDGPPVRCGLELSPTGQANRLWSYRIERALFGIR